jgi:outer membrane lipoprotein-sorting protein
MLGSVALSLLALTASAAQAQPAAEIDPLEQLLEKHYAALGGLEALRAVDKIHVQGVAKTQGMEMPFELWRMRPGFYRGDMEIQGIQMTNAFDGVMAWGVNPMAGSSKPAPLPEGPAATAALQADFDGALVDWRRKRTKLVLHEVVDLGEPLGKAHRIEATLKDGSKHEYFIGTEDFLVRRAVLPVDQGMGAAAVTSDTLEYETVGGILLPKRQKTTSAMGEVLLDYTTNEVGVDIDPEIFYMPGQVADAGLGLEQVLAKHFAARGGADDVQTVVAAGQLGFMGLNIPLTISLAKPNRSKLEADMAGSKMILAFDGEQAWTVSPLQAITVPEALPAEAADLIELFGGFLWGILEDAADNGWTLTLAGVEKVGRDETYKIEMKDANGRARTAYLGGEDFLERRFSLNAEFMGSQQDIDALLTGYEKREGLMVPGEIALNSGGAPVASVKLSEVTVNVELPAETFSMPPAPEAPQE